MNLDAINRILIVFAGGGTGAVARYLAGTAIMSRYSGRFPMGTFVINLTGSFIIGLFMTLLTERLSHPNWRLLLVVGFVGGYTTFSSFEWETLTAMREGAQWTGIVYVLASVILGYIAVWVGSIVARQ